MANEKRKRWELKVKKGFTKLVDKYVYRDVEITNLTKEKWSEKREFRDGIVEKKKEIKESFVLDRKKKSQKRTCNNKTKHHRWFTWELAIAGDFLQATYLKMLLYAKAWANDGTLWYLLLLLLSNTTRAWFWSSTQNLNALPTTCAWKGFKLSNPEVDSPICVLVSCKDVLLCMKSSSKEFYIVNPVTMQWTRS